MGSSIKNIKVLVITSHSETVSKSRLHLKFLRHLEKYVGEYVVLDKITERKKDPSFPVDAESIYDLYKPDLIIGYTSYGLSRTFFSKFPCKKVMIETDFYKKVNNNKLNWYEENGFDLIIQRGSYSPLSKFKIPMVYMPFSADENEFFPVKNWDEKQNIIRFCGSQRSEIYCDRRGAIAALEDAGLIELGKRREPDYPEFIRGGLGFLTSTEIDTAHGKVFEALSSGTVLMTPSFSLKKELLGPPGKGYVEYSRDASDIVDKAKAILNNSDLAKKIAEEGREIFLRKHTHTHRAKELVHHLSRLMAGRKVKRLWSI